MPRKCVQTRYKKTSGLKKNVKDPVQQQSYKHNLGLNCKLSAITIYIVKSETEILFVCNVAVTASFFPFPSLLFLYWIKPLIFGTYFIFPHFSVVQHIWTVKTLALLSYHLKKNLFGGRPDPYLAGAHSSTCLMHQMKRFLLLLLFTSSTCGSSRHLSKMSI